MKTHADQNQAQQNTTAPKVQHGPSAKGMATIVDNRPSTIYQRKLQETINATEATKPKPIQRKADNTGLPRNLKTGIENLSGYSMGDVKVHYNSSKPAQLQALAYAQGTDIHLGPGQEKHLPHEAWHVVQQKQGRVKPTMQLEGKANINDDAGLEREADIMGKKAQSTRGVDQGQIPGLKNKQAFSSTTCQMRLDEEGDIEKLKKIYGWIRSQTTQPADDEIEQIIYNMLGFEEASEYEVQEGDEEFILNLRVKLQDRRNLLDKGIEMLEDTETKERLKEIKERIGKGETTKEDTYHMHQLAYENIGTYYHIKRVIPKEFDEDINERMILNINKQAKAGELLMTINDGWAESTDDWRAYIDGGKFYALSKNQREKEPNLKYDKVVLYYDRKYRSRIIEGVKEIVSEADRNPNISGFYNKIAKGIGIGREIGNESYTTDRSSQLQRWIKMDKGWDEVRRMTEEQFVQEAWDVVMKGLKLDIKDRMSYTGVIEKIDEIYEMLELAERTPGNKIWVQKIKNEVQKVINKLARDKDLSHYRYYLVKLGTLERQVEMEFF